MMLRTCSLLVAIMVQFFCYAQPVTIVPQPVSLQVNNGTFTITKKTVLLVNDEEDKKAARFFIDYVNNFYGFTLSISDKKTTNFIQFTTHPPTQLPQKDAYTLTAAAEGVTIEGNTHSGTFYGMQTLIQLLPILENKNQNFNGKLSIPFVAIQDYPRFAYRGMHLDVSRHFFPVSFVKKYIDYIALHKMNYFHWHLTDDQGWRIEIKKYPKLTQVGSCRNGTIIGRYPGTGNDSIKYCGYYTQQDVKDIVQYAADRYITVVPEIEMPGHSTAALASYPYLSCPNAGPFKVGETWGGFNGVYCAGNDSSFQFLQDVLDEVIALFPSKYIHIGGDEVPKTNWQKCPLCQKRIKEEGLKDEHQLQSYFTQRIEKYVNSKGRTIIGWDEILEGGLAPNAVVMSWRGEAGGIAAAKQKHTVIMTPENYVYFDWSQKEKDDSVTIGHYTPVEKVYAYEPVPKELNTQDTAYILGAQANLWAEYIPYPSKVEYMIFPRISALSEVLWTPKEKRSWPEFEKKLPQLFKRYELWGAHYSRAYYSIKTTLQPTATNNGIAIKFETKDKEGKLLYAIQGQHFPQNYTTPFTIYQSADVTGLYYHNQQLIDSVSYHFIFNKAIGKKITLLIPPSKNYPGDGAFTLVNGIQNTMGLSRGLEFLGFNGTDCEAIIDLNSLQTIDSIIVHSLTQEGSWIYQPKSVELYSSADGKNFKPLGSTTTFEPVQKGNGIMKINITPTAIRYIKVLIHNYGVIPDNKPGANNKAWLFVDEIEVY